MNIFNRQVRENTELQEDNTSAKEEEINKLKTLKDKTDKTNLSKKAQKDIIEELNLLAPGVFSNLDKEAFKTGLVSKEIQKLIRYKELLKAIEDETAFSDSAKKDKANLEKQDMTSWIEKRVLYNDKKIAALNKDRKAKQLEQLDQFIEDSDKRMKIFMTEAEKVGKEIDKTTTTPSTIDPNPTKDKDKKPWDTEIKALEDSLKTKKAINEKAFLEKMLTEEQYNRQNLEDEALFYNQKLKVMKGYEQNVGDVELDIAKNSTAQQKLTFNQEIQIQQEAKDEYLLELERKLDRGEISEKKL